MTWPVEPVDPSASGAEAHAPGITGHGPYRYARWDGTQRLPDLSAEDILDALSDDLMAEGDLTASLRRLLRRGLDDRT